MINISLILSKNDLYQYMKTRQPALGHIEKSIVNSHYFFAKGGISVIEAS